MYKKYFEHLEHFASVGMKYFFNFDFTVFHEACVLVAVVPVIIKFFASGIAHQFNDGLQTIKGDVTSIKNYITTHKQNRGNRAMREVILNPVRSSKNNF